MTSCESLMRFEADETNNFINFERKRKKKLVQKPTLIYVQSPGMHKLAMAIQVTTHPYKKKNCSETVHWLYWDQFYYSVNMNVHETNFYFSISLGHASIKILNYPRYSIVWHML